MLNVVIVFFILTLAYPPIVQADREPFVQDVEFVSDEEAVSLVRLDKQSYAVFSHALDSGLTKHVATLQHTSLVASIGRGVRPNIINIQTDSAVYSYDLATGETSCCESTGEEFIGAVGQGRFVLALHWSGTWIAPVAARIEPIAPEWLQKRLPYPQPRYWLKQCDTGKKVAEKPLPLNTMPQSMVKIGSEVIDVDSATFAVVEDSFGDGNASHAFQVRALNSTSLEEQYRLTFNGHSRGLQKGTDGSLLVVAFQYEDHGRICNIWKIEPPNTHDAPPKVVKLASVKENEDGVHQVAVVENAMLLAQGDKLILKPLPNGEGDIVEIGSSTSFAISPSGRSVFAWHSWDARKLSIDLLDISNSKLKPRQIISLDDLVSAATTISE